ncbi:Predicted nucleotidyltransferase [Eubacterium ruminantium]|nr:Predicted nucleotidyltransferase [Eubacterium ruminantium]
MDFVKLSETSQYDFLRNNKRLGRRIILLGVTGSYGYGTDREGSDVDFRGITLELPSDLIGFSEFEQFEDRETDTCDASGKAVYDGNRYFKISDHKNSSAG